MPSGTYSRDSVCLDRSSSPCTVRTWTLVCIISSSSWSALPGLCQNFKIPISSALVVRCRVVDFINLRAGQLLSIVSAHPSLRLCFLDTKQQIAPIGFGAELRLKWRSFKSHGWLVRNASCDHELSKCHKFHLISLNCGAPQT